MTAEMPYLNEDEIIVNGKTAHSNPAEIDDADEPYLENKVNVNKDGFSLCSQMVIIFV